MANPIVLTDAYIELVTTDISEWVNAVTLDFGAAEQDATNMASGGYAVPVAGLRSGSVTLGLNQDMTDNAIDEFMFGLLFTTVTFKIRASDASLGVNNPEYRGSFVMMGWTPIDGSVGDVSKVSRTFPTSGPITRHTS
jgi:hypothetical protein